MWTNEQLSLFTYSRLWLSDPRAFALDPFNLPLSDQPITTSVNHGTPGIVADAGPDAWGRHVIAVSGRDVPRSNAEWAAHPYAVGVGALRFSLKPEVPIASVEAYPRCTIEQLSEAAAIVEQGGVVSPPMGEILGQLSGPGGARPKALFVGESGRPAIIKFERAKDRAFNVPRVEAACLRAAADAGIGTVPAQLIEFGSSRVALVVDRFDRDDALRPIHYASARTLMHAWVLRSGVDELPPKGRATYQALAAMARRLGVDDAGEVFLRRMAFNVLIHNTDDHLQNTGFLFEAGVWRVAPAFDLLPHDTPVHSIGLGPQGRARSVMNLREGASLFGVSDERVGTIFSEVVEGVRQLPQRLTEAGVKGDECERVLDRVAPFLGELDGRAFESDGCRP